MESEETVEAYGATFKRVRRLSARYQGDLVVERDRTDKVGLKRVHEDDEAVIVATLPAGSGVRALSEDSVRRLVRGALRRQFCSDIHFSSEAIKALTVACNGYLNDLFALTARGTRLRRARVASVRDFLFAAGVMTGNWARLDQAFIDDELGGDTLDIYSRQRLKRARSTDGAGES